MNAKIKTGKFVYKNQDSLICKRVRDFFVTMETQICK